MEPQQNQALQSNQPSFAAERRIKHPYETPTIVTLGKITEITQNVVPGTTSDAFGTGFDPDPFSS